jgi:large subunit ribosomal protein L22
MEAIAQAKHIHIAPRKTRLVVGLIRGLAITEARKQLILSKKAAAKPVLKALNSAVANAEHNLKLDAAEFVVTRAQVDEGIKIKRFTPRAQGRATPIRLRSSHITIGVGPKTSKAKK